MKQQPIIFSYAQHYAGKLWPVTLLVLAVVAPWLVYKSVKEKRGQQ